MSSPSSIAVTGIIIIMIIISVPTPTPVHHHQPPPCSDLEHNQRENTFFLHFWFRSKHKVSNFMNYLVSQPFSEESDVRM